MSEAQEEVWKDRGMHQVRQVRIHGQLDAFGVNEQELHLFGQESPSAVATARQLVESLSAKLNRFITATRKGMSNG